MRHLLGKALLLGMATTAYAGHGDLGYYVNPNVGFMFTDNERASSDSFVYGIGVGRPLSETQNVELDLKITDLDDGGEVYGLGVGLLTYMGESAHSVYSIIRAGITDSDGHPNDDYTALNLAGGLGYRMPLLGFGDLRIEGTLNADLHSNEDSSTNGQKLFFIDPVITLGYQIPLFDKKQAAPAAAGVAIVDTAGDSDNDGVANDADLCPDTPVGTRVDSTGCAPAVAPAIAMDCPAPKADEAVDANGCAVQSSTLLAAVLFEFDSTELTSAAAMKLDAVAASIAGGSGRIEVAGHASDEGDDFYNLDLSQRRANAVRRYLIDQGVSPARIISRGFGDEAPDEVNNTAAGRRQNRRVEVRTAE